MPVLILNRARYSGVDMLCNQQCSSRHAETVGTENELKETNNFCHIFVTSASILEYVKLLLDFSVYLDQRPKPDHSRNCGSKLGRLPLDAQAMQLHELYLKTLKAALTHSAKTEEAVPEAPHFGDAEYAEEQQPQDSTHFNLQSASLFWINN